MERTTLIGLFLLPILIGTFVVIARRIIDDIWEVIRRNCARTYWRVMIITLMILFVLGALLVWMMTEKSPRVEAQNQRVCPVQIINASKGLIGAVLTEQAACVGDSVGIWAHQAFTDEDLKEFVADNKVEKISQSLKTSKPFIEIIDGMRSMNAAKQQELLQQAASTYRPTWAERGTDPHTSSVEELKKGQTEAGNTAERMIAEAVVTVARSLLEK